MTRYGRIIIGVVKIDRILFPGKNPNLNDVKKYLNDNLELEYRVRETGDVLKIGSKFSSEFCGSSYTRKLKGAVLKAKANASQIIPGLIENATNRRRVENKESKHERDAKLGWYRYDAFFSLPVTFDGKQSLNYYRATLVVRINDSGLYLHDIVNIKKEDSKPFES